MLNPARKITPSKTVTQDTSQAIGVRKFAKTMLLLDGFFLLAVGLVSAIAELMSHFWGNGLHGARFFESPYTLGFFEAHGLALLVGLLLMRAANRNAKEQRFWHGFAATIHLFLGGSNLLYWISFVALDFVAQGAIVTIIHGLLIALQLVCYFQSQRLAAE